MRRLVGALLRLQATFMGTIYPEQGNGIRSNPVDLSKEWQVLGPFQIGTRGTSSSQL